MLTIIGMGLDRGDITLSALKAMKNAKKVYLKEGAKNADELAEAGIAFERIASVEGLFDEAENDNVCLCVDGSAFSHAELKPLLYDRRVNVIDCFSYKTLTDEELTQKTEFTFGDFVYILRRLRAPDGCPWDRAQTHESIRINMIEEAYELVDAIDSDERDKILEETGDVLMQAVFHALIEEERGRFGVDDMLGAISKKLVTRHTHVFGGDSAKGADGALSVWDKNKMKEKKQETYSDAVNDVPECFPALLRAQKIVKRMAKGGWNFQTPEALKKKFAEEAEELALAAKSKDKARIAEEMGDVLMVLMHAAYLLGVDAEQALLDTAKKAAARFTEWEKLVLADGKDVHALSNEEWNAYYQKAKNNVPSR